MSSRSSASHRPRWLARACPIDGSLAKMSDEEGTSRLRAHPPPDSHCSYRRLESTALTSLSGEMSQTFFEIGQGLWRTMWEEFRTPEIERLRSF